MEKHYNWKTKLFSKKFEIYQHEILKGEIYKENWSRKVKGELNVTTGKVRNQRLSSKTKLQ